MPNQSAARRRGASFVLGATFLWSLAGLFARLIPHLDFGTVLFGQNASGADPTCEATVNGVTAPIGGFHSYHAIFLAGSSSASFAAVPSALYPDGASFSVQRR